MPSSCNWLLPGGVMSIPDCIREAASDVVTHIPCCTPADKTVQKSDPVMIQMARSTLTPRITLYLAM